MADPLIPCYHRPVAFGVATCPECSQRFRLVWRIGKGKLEPSQVISPARRAAIRSRLAQQARRGEPHHICPGRRRADEDTREGSVLVTARAPSPYGGIATCSAQ